MLPMTLVSSSNDTAPKTRQGVGDGGAARCISASNSLGCRRGTTENSAGLAARSETTVRTGEAPRLTSFVAVSPSEAVLFTSIIKATKRVSIVFLPRLVPFLIVVIVRLLSSRTAREARCMSVYLCAQGWPASFPVAMTTKAGDCSPHAHGRKFVLIIKVAIFLVGSRSAHPCLSKERSRRS